MKFLAIVEMRQMYDRAPINRRQLSHYAGTLPHGALIDTFAPNSTLRSWAPITLAEGRQRASGFYFVTEKGWAG
jgi:hypothetical protein